MEDFCVGAAWAASTGYSKKHAVSSWKTEQINLWLLLASKVLKSRSQSAHPAQWPQKSSERVTRKLTVQSNLWCRTTVAQRQETKWSVISLSFIYSSVYHKFFRSYWCNQPTHFLPIFCNQVNAGLQVKFSWSDWSEQNPFSLENTYRYRHAHCPDLVWRRNRPNSSFAGGR